MNGLPHTAPSPNQPMSRDLVMSLADAALRTGELRYARRLCTSWLAIYPGDLEVNLLCARAYFNEKSTDLKKYAAPILEELGKSDPEYLEAQELLAEAQRLAGTPAYTSTRAVVHALSPSMAKSGAESDWSKNVHAARIALEKVRSGDYQEIETTEYLIHKSLVENPGTPLAAVTHLRLMGLKESMPKTAVRSLAQIYHERWPDCLQFTLTLADEMMDSGDTSEAVILLHKAVSKDISGQVPRRMWGENHPYKTLWPSNLLAQNTGQNSPQNIPIPAAVASSLGWNQIGAGPAANNFSAAPTNLPPQNISTTVRTYTPTISLSRSAQVDETGGLAIPLSEQAQDVQVEFERLAGELKKPHVVHEDGRFPVYLIFTTRGGLQTLYGNQAVNEIEIELKKLAKAIQGQKINQEYWGSLLFYADDPAYTQPLNLKPAPYDDPYQLKIIIDSLDTVMEKKGERIGAVLIVGGPEVVPFHKLPNPVEDADADVPSDNPYAAKDGNYFISDWPVGRISGGVEKNPQNLLTIIRAITDRYSTGNQKFSLYYRVREYLQELFRRGISRRLSSFGYTAAVWQKASQSVYQTIGASNDMLVSPPTHTCESNGVAGVEEMATKNNGNTCLLLPQTRLAYFNLHGVPDGAEWYGQVDPTQPEEGPDYPVAMHPRDIHNNGSATKLVFSEACYGANIIGKTIEDAISLKFITSGTQALIGSTCISYGSISTPLTAADLLGKVFWSLLQEGFTAGESLRRAKIHLTREMHSRQGFLDAEDQKTIISFVLFGDPLAQPFKPKVSPKIIPHLSDSAVPVPTVCEQADESTNDNPVSMETISQLKKVVEQYIPGMGDANMKFSRERQSCSYFCNHYWTGKKCIQSQQNGKDNPAIKYHRRVVTLSKSYEQSQHVHRQYARFTLDDDGKIVKMVVSR